MNLWFQFSSRSRHAVSAETACPFLLRLTTDGACMRRSRGGEDIPGRCLPPGSLWCRSSLVAHITASAAKMSGSQAARTRRPAVVRPGCVAVEKALVDALSCGRGYITQPAVIPDNFVELFIVHPAFAASRELPEMRISFSSGSHSTRSGSVPALCLCNLTENWNSVCLVFLHVSPGWQRSLFLAALRPLSLLCSS